MPFDANSDQPLLQPKKRTTKVNLFMAAAIVVFLAVAGFVAWHVWKHPPRTANDVAPMESGK